MQFAVSPATSAYDYAKPLPLPSAKDIWLQNHPLPLSLLADGKPKDISHHKYSDSEYRDAKNQMPELIKLELVEQVQDQDQPNQHKAKRYKLTKNGVYFIIAQFLTSAVASNMLMDYGDHPMFRFFLYPLISPDTLSRLTALNSRSLLFSHVSPYLNDCCKEADDANNYLELNKPLFIWEEILTGNEHAKSLCNFLKQKFGSPWLDNAEIQKSDPMFFEIKGTGSNTVSIHLSDDRKKATVSYEGKKRIELSVENSFDNAFRPVLLVQKPTRLDESYIKDFFAKEHYKLVQQLLFSIVSDEYIDSDAVRILLEDSTFREVLEDVKVQFDDKYKRFDSIIKTLTRP
ncbi:MAG: hypothetical protein WBZ36_09760 [Candidatus Nitrosopolaris sp.]